MPGGFVLSLGQTVGPVRVGNHAVHRHRTADGPGKVLQRWNYRDAV